MEISIKLINLLWTGGWDSTFELLQTVLIYKSTVQPYYIIDPNRRSMNNELMAIRKIKEALFNSFPETKELILPIIFRMVDDIIIDPTIEMAFQEFKKEKHMGIQYLWLASFCKSEGIYDMQLSIEASDTPDPNLWDSNIQDILIDENINNQVVYKIDPTFQGTKEYEIFKYFTFPLIKITKVEMLQIARKRNWLSFINQSRFCLFPTKKGQPCGICKPCTQTLMEGFTHRMPQNRILYASYVNKIETPIKTIIKQFLGPLVPLKK